MQTATLKKATEELGVSFEDIVYYRKQGNKATIEINLKLPRLVESKNVEVEVFDNMVATSEDLGINDPQNVQVLESLIEAANAVIAQLETFRIKASTLKSKVAMAQSIMTPEEEFRQKYPNIKINRPELFKLVGCMAEVPPNVSDKDLIIDAIESKYGK
jgi:predicted transcriptional regulator